MSERISREQLVEIYKVELAFFDSLEESGLLHTITENNIKYLMYDELSDFERFANWHYDLEVNLPGIEMLHALLQKMEKVQLENRNLLQKLNSLSEKWD